MDELFFTRPQIFDTAFGSFKTNSPAPFPVHATRFAHSSLFNRSIKNLFNFGRPFVVAIAIGAVSKLVSIGCERGFGVRGGSQHSPSSHFSVYSNSSRIIAGVSKKIVEYLYTDKYALTAFFQMRLQKIILIK